MAAAVSAQAQVEDGGLPQTEVTWIEVKGTRYPVFPNVVSSSYVGAQPFAYIQPVVIKRGAKSYDPVSHTVQFSLAFDYPSEAETTAAGRRILEKYQQAQDKIAPALVPLSAATMVGYELRLSVRDKQVVLERRDVTPVGGGDLVKSFEITDEKLRAVIEQDPSAVMVEFYGLYKVRQAEFDRVVVERSAVATRKAFEKVFGQNPDPYYHVNRTAQVALNEALKEQIVSEVQATNPGRVAELQKVATDELRTLKPLTLDELRTAEAKAIIYTAAEGKVELTPVQVKNAIGSITTHDKLYDSMTATWDKLVEIANKKDAAKSSYKQVRDYFASGGGGGASGGVSLFFGLHRGNATANASFWKKAENESLSKEDERLVDEFMSRVRDAGSQSRNMAKESYQQITGLMERVATEVKSVDLYRVDQAGLNLSYAKVVGYILNRGMVTRAYMTPLPLAVGDFLAEQKRFDAMFTASKLPTDGERFAKMLAKAKSDWRHYRGPLIVTNNLEEFQRFVGYSAFKPGDWDHPVLVVKESHVYYSSTTNGEAQPHTYTAAIPLLPAEFGNEVVAAWLVPTDHMVPMTRRRSGDLTPVTLDPFQSCAVSVGGHQEEKNRITFSIRADPDKPRAGYFELHVIYRGPEAQPSGKPKQ